MAIGFIGLGNMGASLARAVRRSLPDERLLLANRSPEKVTHFVEQYGGEAASVATVFEEADLVVIGVKPHQFEALLAQAKDLLSHRPSLVLVSMAAGLDLETLRSYTTDATRWIRMMPNTPVAVGAGVVSYTVGPGVSFDEQMYFERVFAQAGDLVPLAENLIDAATALAGCGPAFVFRFAEALADAGVLAGLPRQLAQDMATQTLLGSAELLRQTKAHPAVLKDQVTSPGGSTILGTATLDQAGFSGIVISAVQAAFEKTQSLRP
ncbi:pyrroline-5-carboxylate reductase [Streptococcus sp. DD12]|uniref:pyrroline-5-carboxylate reductase n=1 Tax=Streptococcus sp. DD12 TaxID=1777880 RepID=UPI00079845D7|nr:pyrroline-5-carboxylate reductase [Streptococcus sp. DD12]KXT75928.1 Pyrroline-5-carboxylate reductase [Streptococcus sp. DD12]